MEIVFIIKNKQKQLSLQFQYMTLNCKYLLFFFCAGLHSCSGTMFTDVTEKKISQIHEVTHCYLTTIGCSFWLLAFFLIIIHI